MRRHLAMGLAAVVWAGAACYEPPPEEPPPPIWYWHNGPTASDLYDLDSTARDDVWAVGVDDGGRGTVLRFQAFQWEIAALPSAEDIGPLYAVAADEVSGDVWAAGGGPYFLYWNGSQWRTWPHPAPGKVVYGLDLVDELNGWAVGEGGLLLQLDNGAWAEVASPTGETLRRVQVLSATSAWAVGDGGTVLRYDGSRWQEAFFLPTIDLRDLYFFGDDDGWVIGNVASLYRWDGVIFLKYPSPDVNINYQCCTFIGPNAGFAGGDKVRVVKYVDDEWEIQQDTPSGLWQLFAMHMVTDTEGWAVGDNGTFLWYR